jgi:hypothetical protein
MKTVIKNSAQDPCPRAARPSRAQSKFKIQNSKMCKTALFQSNSKLFKDKDLNNASE